MKRILRISFAIVFTLASACSALAAEEAGQQISPAGSQPSVIGPAEFFTGHVRVDQLYPSNAHINASGSYVTFEPGARSVWHTHPQGQFLVVVAGVGRTQEWGKPVKEIEAGDVVWCPPGVKHWHGAAQNVAMVHIATSGTKDGKNVQWMERVTDEQYNTH
jgi:quercetin dioxygenase-like cupin family protein